VTNLIGPWPHYAADEIAAATAVLASGRVNYWTGTEARDFEREYASSLGVRHAIALMNGTVALELPLRLWGIGPGDEVIVTPRSFIASVSAAVLQGATPVFADVDRDSQNLTVESIERVLTPRTRAIIPVHLAGWPCDMDGIMRLAAARGIRVLEDCAQAHGATVHGRQAGSFGHAAAFSFCQDKIITTAGEGGLLATDDETLWRAGWAFKDHGKSHEAVYQRNHAPGFRWLHESFGTNWRITEVQAAIGRCQLRKLPAWLAARRRNARILIEALDKASVLRLPVPPASIGHAYYRLYAFCRPEALRADWSRDRIVAEVTAAGVPCFSGSCSEIYREKAFEGTGFAPTAPLPVARELGDTSLAFLVHPTLEPDQMERMARMVAGIVARAAR
jgi:dTDP-4-amino-4,6-dideoxygalactose transaminase